MSDTKKVCLVPGCGFVAKSRGLCKKHYSEASYLVKIKKTTWMSLERRGKCKASQCCGLTESQRWFLGKPALAVGKPPTASA